MYKLKSIIKEQLDPRSGKFAIYGYALKEEVDNVSQLLSSQIEELRGDFTVYKEQHKTIIPPLKLNIPSNVESLQFEGIGSFKDLCALVLKNKARIGELGRHYNKMDDDLDAFRHQFDLVKHEVKNLMKNKPEQSFLKDSGKLTSSNTSIPSSTNDIRSSSNTPKRLQKISQAGRSPTTSKSDIRTLSRPKK